MPAVGPKYRERPDLPRTRVPWECSTGDPAGMVVPAEVEVLNEEMGGRWSCEG